MSSDLKDARWQLAEDLATEDGADFHEMDYATKELYLTVARQRLAVASPTVVEVLALRFREGPDGD